MKKCTQCGIEKDETEFYKDERQSSGLRCNCKTCHDLVRNKWREKHPENIQKSCKKYYENNKEKWRIREKNLSDEQRQKKRLFCKHYYETNKDEILQKRRQKYKTIPTNIKCKYSQTYYELHKEEVCNRSRQHYKNLSDAEKEQHVERTKIWRHENRQKMRAWSAVGNALKSGKLVKPSKCEICMKEGLRIHSHHNDYSKPFEVIWVCHKCHMSIHREKRKI